MTLQQLRYVAMVAEKGTMTEAATELYISQPSLTKLIREQEKVLRKIMKVKELMFTELFVAKPHIFISSRHPLAS